MNSAFLSGNCHRNWTVCEYKENDGHEKETLRDRTFYRPKVDTKLATYIFNHIVRANYDQSAREKSTDYYETNVVQHLPTLFPGQIRSRADRCAWSVRPRRSWTKFMVLLEDRKRGEHTDAECSYAEIWWNVATVCHFSHLGVLGGSRLTKMTDYGMI